MSKKAFLYPLMVMCCMAYIFSACNNEEQRPPETDIAQTPEELEKKTPDIIQSSLEFASKNDGRIDDSIRLSFTKQVQLIYEKNQFASVWSYQERWKPLADSLFNFIG